MNRLYLAIPTALLLLFGGVYYQHAETAASAAQAATAAANLARQKEADAKQELERKAQADAAQRLAAELTAEQKQQEDKRAKWDAESVRLAADIAAINSKSAELAAEVTRSEAQLADLHATKDGLGRESFDLEKSVELARIAKRNAEFELQRLTAMLARQAAGVTLPPLPPAEP
jgi:chromosome segregation ATPase